MKKTYLRSYISSGFTLIELLVVIAIIGILSSVVLASLSTARNRGKDASLLSQLSSMRAQAELYTGTNTSYDPDSSGTSLTGGDVGPCSAAAGTIFDTADNGLGKLFTGLTLANGRCVSNRTAWAVSFNLSANTSNSWCVDSTGVSKSYTYLNTVSLVNATSKCR